MTPRRRAVTVLIAALLGAVLTARLGFWQLDRAAQKVAAAAAVEAQGGLPALSNAEVGASTLYADDGLTTGEN